MYFADYIDSHPEIVNGKSVLELGAGAGLPSIVAYLNGANCVVATDYPESQLIDALEMNINRNIAIVPRREIVACGHLWGHDVESILKQNSSGRRFDVIILCDLIFNHSQHANMLKTCVEALNDGGKAFCLFSHHRPWLAQKDLEFFKIASADPFRFTVKQFQSQSMNVMFENDPGDEEVRKLVHFYELTRPSNSVAASFDQ